jgi:hypothetical protein
MDFTTNLEENDFDYSYLPLEYDDNNIDDVTITSTSSSFTSTPPLPNLILDSSFEQQPVSLPKQKRSYNIRAGSKRKSAVWKHFNLEDKSVRCNVIVNKNGREIECGRVFEYHGNTTGMWYHLNAEHDITKDRIIKKQVTL